MCIRVRITVGYQYIIVIIWIKQKFTLKFDCKWKTTVKATVFSLKIRCVITNIVTISVPSNVFCCSIFLWIKERFHSDIIKTVRLKKINDIESILHIFSGVSNWEKVPLSMPICIKISSQNKIVLKLTSE